MPQQAVIVYVADAHLAVMCLRVVPQLLQGQLHAVDYLGSQTVTVKEWYVCSHVV